MPAILDIVVPQQMLAVILNSELAFKLTSVCVSSKATICHRLDYFFLACVISEI